MQAFRPADDDRLPWLEPYREARTPDRPRARGGSRRSLAIGSALGLMIAAGAGGYWLGQRTDEPARPRPSTTIPLPTPRPAPVEVAQPPAVQPPAPEPAAQPEPAPPVAAAPQVPSQRPAAEQARAAKKVTKRRQPVRKIRAAGTQRSNYGSVRARQEQRARARSWPKMPSPGPAGQVIQLGAFSTPARAYSAYNMRIARYPLLARMPRVVVPVVSRSDGRRLYVLRLGTTSRQQSKTVCRNLRRSGDHCLVIG